MKYCTINCTVKNIEDAKSLSKHLVNMKLIACSNIIPQITSVYNWQNKVEEESEVLLIMKTKTSLYKKTEEEIKKLHKYENPEISCLPVIDGSRYYLDWIDEQTI